MKVWTIESGQYSDYRVDGIFSTRENAEAVAAKLTSEGKGWHDYRIEERELDPGVEGLREGYGCFVVWMLRDGTVESVRQWEWDISDSTPEVWRRSQAPINQGKNVPDCLNTTVFARDEQHAIKIANEQRAQLIANNEWPEAVTKR